MSCNLCNRTCEFICSCKYIFLCLEHSRPHRNQPGNHNCEPLDVTLNDLDAKILHKKAMDSVKRLKNSKLKISSSAIRIVKKIESQSHRIQNQLDDLIRTSLALIITNKLSRSLKIYAEGLMCLTLNHQVNFQNFDLVLKNIFNKDLSFINIDNEVFKVTEQLPQKRVFSNQVGEPNIGECKKQISQGNTDIQKILNKNIFNSQDSNLWSLEQKKEFLEALHIEDYKETFGRGNSFRGLIKDIKFTDYWEYSFICKIYSGNLNEDFNEGELQLVNCENADPEYFAVINLQSKILEWSKSDWEEGALEEARTWFKRYSNCYTKCGNFTI